MQEADDPKFIPRPCRVYCPIPENYTTFHEVPARLALGAVNELCFALALVA